MDDVVEAVFLFFYLVFSGDNAESWHQIIAEELSFSVTKKDLAAASQVFSCVSPLKMSRSKFDIDTQEKFLVCAFCSVVQTYHIRAQDGGQFAPFPSSHIITAGAGLHITAQAQRLPPHGRSTYLHLTDKYE